MRFPGHTTFGRRLPRTRRQEGFLLIIMAARLWFERLPAIECHQHFAANDGLLSRTCFELGPITGHASRHLGDFISVAICCVFDDAAIVISCAAGMLQYIPLISLPR